MGGSGAGLVLWAATLARLSMSFQYSAVAAMGPALIAEYQLTLAQLGLLVALFTLPAIALALPAGLLSQRFGDVSSGIAALALLTLGAYGGVIADSFGEHAMARTVAGAGATLITIVSGTILARWFAGHALANALSISMFSWPLGLGLALALIPAIVEYHGTRTAFGVMSASSLVPFLLYVLIRLRGAAAPIARVKAPGPLAGLRGRDLAFVSVSSLLWLCFNGAFILMLSFGPVHIQGGEISAVEAGLILSTALIANGIATLFAGRIAAMVGNAGRLMMACGLGLAITLVLLVVSGPSTPVLLIIGVFSALPVPPVMALIVSSFDDSRRNTAMGVFYMLFYTALAGLVPAAGLVGDTTQSTAAPILAGAALAVIAVLTLPLFFRLRPNAVSD